MDRRFFLKLLGLTPAVPALAKVAVESSLPQASPVGKVLVTDGSGNLMWGQPDPTTKVYVDQQVSNSRVIHHYLVQDRKGVCALIVRAKHPAQAHALPASVMYSALFVADLTENRVLKNRSKDNTLPMPLSDGYLLPEAYPVCKGEVGIIVAFEQPASGFYAGLETLRPA